MRRAGPIIVTDCGFDGLMSMGKGRLLVRCQDFTAQTTDLMDGALDWRQRLAMRLHLAICDACRGFFRQMRDAVRLVGALPASPPSPDTEAHILAALSRDDTPAP